jgi:hypothetical protein
MTGVEVFILSMLLFALLFVIGLALAAWFSEPITRAWHAVRDHAVRPVVQFFHGGGKRRGGWRP